jgi:hypothetical protein
VGCECKPYGWLRQVGVSPAATVAAIRAALEAAGVEFTNGDAPGVRLRSSPPANHE